MAAIKKVAAPSVPYRPDFLERPRDREYAAAYIQSVIDEGDMQLLLATLDLPEAYGGMTTVVQKGTD